MGLNEQKGERVKMITKQMKKVAALTCCFLLLFPALAGASTVTRTIGWREPRAARMYSDETPRRREARIRAANSGRANNPGSAHRLWACNVSFNARVPNNAIVSSFTINLSRGQSQNGSWQRNPLRQAPSVFPSNLRGPMVVGTLVGTAGVILNPHWRASINSRTSAASQCISFVDAR